jgi:hypothetical protein
MVSVVEGGCDAVMVLLFVGAGMLPNWTAAAARMLSIPLIGRLLDELKRGWAKG